MLGLVLTLLIPWTHADLLGYHVRYVPDGDGLVLVNKTDNTTVVTRFCGIDCPEAGQDGKNEAKRVLEALLAQNTFFVHVYDHPDCHGRTLISLLRTQVVHARGVRRESLEFRETGLSSPEGTFSSTPSCEKGSSEWTSLSARMLHSGLCVLYEPYSKSCIDTDALYCEAQTRTATEMFCSTQRASRPLVRKEELGIQTKRRLVQSRAYHHQHKYQHQHQHQYQYQYQHARNQNQSRLGPLSQVQMLVQDTNSRRPFPPQESVSRQRARLASRLFRRYPTQNATVELPWTYRRRIERQTRQPFLFGAITQGLFSR